MMDQMKVLKRIHTARRTPNPVKITLAGWKTYQIMMSADPGQVYVPMLTTPTPLRVLDNASRTFTVGSNHFVSLSMLR